MENFYITIEKKEDKGEELIKASKGSAYPKSLGRTEKHRDNFNFLKRSIIPLRESLFSFKSVKDDHLFNAVEIESFSFFSRLHQKNYELLEQIESDLGSIESVSNFYFSAKTQKMNEIMETLTIVSALFIPLTFIVGVYGMNFKFMPELHYPNGYFIVIGILIIIALGMLFYFKKRKWF
jgi:magnesium transporter